MLKDCTLEVLQVGLETDLALLSVVQGITVRKTEITEWMRRTQSGLSAVLRGPEVLADLVAKVLESYHNSMLQT